jgi:hypothetical protein
MRPEKGSYPGYYEQYIKLVHATDVMEALRGSRQSLKAISVPGNMEDHAYAPGKWTVKELLLHIADTERVISYRALRFARRDPQQPLPFEENAYAANSGAGARTVGSIVSEILLIRESTLALFESFSSETLLCRGKTSYGETTVLALGYLIAGHGLHHLQVLNDRYLTPAKPVL